jgi:amidase
VGPIARDVEGIVSGMRLIDSTFAASDGAGVVGRFRPSDVDVDPALDAAVDRVLHEAEVELLDIELEGWDQIAPTFRALIMSESWESNAALIQGSHDRVGEPVRSRLEACTDLDQALIPIAVLERQRWRATVADALTRVQAIVMPTLIGQPPPLGADGVENILVFPWNVSGSPALALPVPVEGWTMSGSLQIVGPDDSEEMLCATGAVLEAAVRSL